MMIHLGGEMGMISQVTRPQNHSKKKNRAKTNKSKRKRKGPKSRLLHLGYVMILDHGTSTD